MPLSPTVPMENRLAYNGKETAALLGITPSTLSRETTAGRIRKNIIGLYPRPEIERYLRDTLETKEVKQ